MSCARRRCQRATPNAAVACGLAAPRGGPAAHLEDGVHVALPRVLVEHLVEGEAALRVPIRLDVASRAAVHRVHPLAAEAELALGEGPEAGDHAHVARRRRHRERPRWEPPPISPCLAPRLAAVSQASEQQRCPPPPLARQQAAAELPPRPAPRAVSRRGPSIPHRFSAGLATPPPPLAPGRGTTTISGCCTALERNPISPISISAPKSAQASAGAAASGAAAPV